MGTPFEIHVVSNSRPTACGAMGAALDEVARLEALLSEYLESSDVRAVNRAAGQHPVEVHPEVFELFEWSEWTSRVTEGAFDITFAACRPEELVRERRVASDEEIAACLEDIGYAKIQADRARRSIYLPQPGMRIGFGGIGHGYGVDKAAEVLLARGITRFAVDGGGELRVQGLDVDGPWVIYVAHPRDPQHPYATLRLDHGAVTTSGDYVKFFDCDGVRYHHVIDPATGRPARRSVAVTVFAPTATEADALDTGLFVLGPERGLALVQRLGGVEALFFAPDLTVHMSPGFPLDQPAPADRPRNQDPTK